MQLEEAHQLHGDTDTRGTSAQEQNAVLGQRHSGGRRRELGGIQESGQDNRPGALDIVVEHRVAVSEAIQIEERLVCRKILELDKELREADRHLVHELLHELRHLLGRDAGLAETEVKWVLKEFLVISADIETDRNG